MKAIIILPICFLIIMGCSSTPQTSANAPVANVERDFVVRDQSPEVAPDWAKDFYGFKRNNDGKGTTHFYGESGDTNDRVAACEVAGLQAKKEIANQIATLITDRIGASKAGMVFIDKDKPEDPGLRRHYEQTIGSKAMAFVAGVKTFGKFWRELDYSQANGKKRVYTCTTVVTIDDRGLQDAIRRAAQHTYSTVIEDPEAKKLTKEALKDLDTQFRAYSSTGN